jgi:hypothetical protein
MKIRTQEAFVVQLHSWVFTLIYPKLSPLRAPEY